MWALIVYFVPVNLIPWPIIWLYDKLLWVTGPVLMITEIILALNFQMRCGQRAIDRIQEDDSPAVKVILIFCELRVIDIKVFAIGFNFFKFLQRIPLHLDFHLKCYLIILSYEISFVVVCGSFMT